MLPEGKQVFSINYIVCTNSLGIVSHNYQGMAGTLPKSETPGAGQGLTLKAGLLKDSSLRLAMLTLLMHSPALR